jgi:hypothetical protein
VAEEKLRINGPYFQMGVDDDPLRICREAGSGLGQKRAASQGIIDQVHNRPVNSA